MNLQSLLTVVSGNEEETWTASTRIKLRFTIVVATG